MRSIIALSGSLKIRAAIADNLRMDLQMLIERRPSRLSDEALTGTARAWFRALPWRQRPRVLCERFPRVANHLAWCWHDAALCEQALEDLLLDRRGGRRGFPAGVVRELQRLRAWRR